MAMLLIWGATTIASPVAAQSWTGINSGPQVSVPPRTSDAPRQVVKADRAIRAARKSGQITHAEARRLRRAGAAIDAMADRYAANGLSAGEASELDTRADVLTHRVFYDRLTSSAAASHP